MSVGGGAWVTVAALFAVGTLYAASVPGWHFTWLVAIFIGWSLYGLGWLVELGAGLVRRERRDALRREWSFWAVPPLVVVLVGALVHVGAPVRTRFELSRGSLDHFARAVSEGRASGERQWIGHYPVEYWEVSDW
ncbi:hypothetical protein [Nonomuraea gerenzanensis]|uniref:Uncharacterized protein n=1 Tax=Nonomuraea gerenzanensis TaxID=93944 RepID=A0A1M4DZE0_9ACTN|nr:hypothetical protein [Nonomuraea gerenzanensis]UBU14233.1 hypothetical protein LCN96_04165 [Nonomuraea gerenzanensis]SBO91929.1 hypothetical protein BN4615_P1443 [Nonomuraea gerenzanensis]